MTGRAICVVTASRAEYGLLHPLMSKIKLEPQLGLQLVVTGAHLSDEFGATHQEIERDGFDIDRIVRLSYDDDSRTGAAAVFAEISSETAKALAELQPDLIVLLGDRYETLGAAIAALILNIPIAHIHGGEETLGAFDNAMRHAITKMSFLHFAASDVYRQRIIQMGEGSDRVFNVGALVLDNIAGLLPASKAELEADIGADLGNKFLLVTYHPDTAPPANDDLPELLAALEGDPSFNILITGVNADPGHSKITAMLYDFAKKNRSRVIIRKSLGWKNYLNAMKNCSAVVGNSSSGLIEAPAIGAPTINIGRRQTGRLRAASVIDCDANRQEISAAIERACSSEFKDKIREIDYPLGKAGASARITDILKEADLTGASMKKFYDIPELQIAG